MATTKDQIYESLRHFPESDCEDTSPNNTYSAIGWDGDEIKLLSSTNISSKMFQGATLNTAGLKTSGNVGAAGSLCTAVEYGDSYNHSTTITIAGLTKTLAGANLGFGFKIYDFPLGAVKVKRALINLTMIAATDTTVGEVGLGTVIATGAVTTLGGTATFENFVDGFANTAPSPTGGATQAQKECETDNPDGTSTALDLYLNFAGAWTASEVLTINGTITFTWEFLGTY